MDPRNRGALADPDATGRASMEAAPPYIAVHLKVTGDTVVQAKFEAQGCGYTIACCSVLTEAVTGRSLAQAAAYSPPDILRALEQVPRHRHFCATLAVEAMQDALRRLPSQPPRVDEMDGQQGTPL